MNRMFILADTAIDLEERNSRIVSFFSMDNLKEMFNEFCRWSVSAVGTLIIALLIWIIGKKIIKIVSNIVKKMLDKSTLDAGIINFAISMLRFVLYAVLIMIVVDKLGIQTTSLLTLFGSAALAIGMSLQGSLSNFAGGILILIFKPFKIGDYIVTGDKEGTVKSIELLYTRLLTVDNKVIMLPNGALANSSIVNVGAENTRRLDIQMSIGYSSDVKKAKRLLTEVMEANKYVLQDNEKRALVKSLDESCVTIETRCWVKGENYWDVRFDLLEAYKEIFDQNGVEIPFNQLDVHMK